MKILDRKIYANKRIRYEEPMIYGDLWLHRKRTRIVWVIFNVLLVINIIFFFFASLLVSSRTYAQMYRNPRPRNLYMYMYVLIVMCNSCLCCGVRHDNGQIMAERLRRADREILEIARHSENPKTLSISRRILASVPGRPIVLRPPPSSFWRDNVSLGTINVRKTLTVLLSTFVV